MKFIKCVIEVRPFLLLVDCMAACKKVHQRACLGSMSTGQEGSIRIQQQHLHPQALGASGLCVAFEVTGCSSQWMPSYGL